MNIWQELDKPILILAPMDDVTDTVFRRIVAGCARPDVFFTEFANVDGYQSPGKHAVEKKLRFYPEEQPLIAQLWGVKPENFYKTAKDLSKKGYAGLDLNMGCPVKNVIKAGACAALIQNRDLAHEIIIATQKGAGELPVSIKTRIGTKDYDESWLGFLLEHKPAMLTVHFRSVKEMSKVDAHWELAEQIVELRNKISPNTLIIGNGDVLTRDQAEKLSKKYNLDGIMIGRGIFSDPYIFAKDTPWKNMTKERKVELFVSHIELFEKEWGRSKNPAILKKFAKVYINGFDGAKELREKLMQANSTEELLKALR
jgi:tRNA-dihydrouridine synthase